MDVTDSRTQVCQAGRERLHTLLVGFVKIDKSPRGGHKGKVTWILEDAWKGESPTSAVFRANPLACRFHRRCHLDRQSRLWLGGDLLLSVFWEYDAAMEDAPDPLPSLWYVEITAKANEFHGDGHFSPVMFWSNIHLGRHTVVPSGMTGVTTADGVEVTYNFIADRHTALYGTRHFGSTFRGDVIEGEVQLCGGQPGTLRQFSEIRKVIGTIVREVLENPVEYKVRRELQRAFKDPKHGDGKILVFHVHWAKLSQHSFFFAGLDRAIPGGDFSESCTDSVTNQGFRAEIMECLLIYCYTQFVPNLLENAQSLIQLAHLYGLQDLVVQCEFALIQLAVNAVVKKDISDLVWIVKDTYKLSLNLLLVVTFVIEREFRSFEGWLEQSRVAWMDFLVEFSDFNTERLLAVELREI